MLPAGVRVVDAAVKVAVVVAVKAVAVVRARADAVKAEGVAVVKVDAAVVTAVVAGVTAAAVVARAGRAPAVHAEVKSHRATHQHQRRTRVRRLNPLPARVPRRSPSRDQTSPRRDLLLRSPGVPLRSSSLPRPTPAPASRSPYRLRR